MEEQNRVNEGKDRNNTQRQETEVVTGTEKVDEGIIRKVRTQEKSAQNRILARKKKFKNKEGY